MFAAAFLICTSCCMFTEAERPYYETKFLEWQEEAVNDLKLGRPLTKDYLAEHAEEHLEFLLEQLPEKPYTTVILQKSPLGKKYASRFKDARTLKECQRIWQKILEDIVYEKKFAEWQQSVEKNLKGPGRALYGDPRLTAYLGQHADKHLEFLLEKLQEERWVYEILSLMGIFQKHALEEIDPMVWKNLRSQFKRSTGNRNTQKTWLKILSRLVYEEKFAQWQEAFAVEIRKNETPQLQDDDLTRYLIQHAAENVDFLRQKLTEDRFTVLILEKSSLDEKYRSQINLDESTGHKRKVWLKLLPKSQQEKTNAGPKTTPYPPLPKQAHGNLQPEKRNLAFPSNLSPFLFP